MYARRVSRWCAILALLIATSALRADDVSVRRAEDALFQARQALGQADEALRQARQLQAGPGSARPAPVPVPGTPPVRHIRAAAPGRTFAESSSVGTYRERIDGNHEVMESAKAALPQAAAPAKKPAPFAFGDFTWLNGGGRVKNSRLDTPVFTGEFRMDTNYSYSFNKPRDHTLSGSTNTNRSQEVQVEQVGIGGDFHYDNVRGRVLTQFGLYSTSQPRNDASPGVGQWDLRTAHRYISEAYGGYHFDPEGWYGVNLDMGIFMSYIGLCSYYNFDNWAVAADRHFGIPPNLVVEVGVQIDL